MAKTLSSLLEVQTVRFRTAKVSNLQSNSFCLDVPLRYRPPVLPFLHGGQAHQWAQALTARTSFRGSISGCRKDWQKENIKLNKTGVSVVHIKWEQFKYTKQFKMPLGALPKLLLQKVMNTHDLTRELENKNMCEEEKKRIEWLHGKREKKILCELKRLH